MHFLGCPNLERRAALSLSNLLDITLVIIFAVKSFLAAVLRPRRGANQRVSPLCQRLQSGLARGEVRRAAVPVAANF